MEQSTQPSRLRAQLPLPQQQSRSQLPLLPPSRAMLQNLMLIEWVRGVLLRGATEKPPPMDQYPR
jgi:hypothetical protein